MKLRDIYKQWVSLDRQAAELKRQADELKAQLAVAIPAGVTIDGIRHTVTPRKSVRYKGLLDTVCSEVPQAGEVADSLKDAFTAISYSHKFEEVAE